MWKIIIVIIFLMIILLLLECRREIKTFRTVHYRVHSEKLNGLGRELKAVFLSDLHNYVYGNENDVLLRAIKRANPDLILIGGDMLVGKKNVSCEPAIRFVKKLPEIAPVYYSYGNHEQRMEENTDRYGTAFGAYRRELEACSVCFLDNASADIKIGTSKIRICGLTIPSAFYEKFKKKSFQGRQVDLCIGQGNSEVYQILLSHHPGYFEAYKEWGADLTLAGHLHGGVVRIPGFRGVITPQAFLFPKYSGEMTIDGKSVIVVSKGLGIHTIPIRLFNPAEMIVMHLAGGENE